MSTASKFGVRVSTEKIDPKITQETHVAAPCGQLISSEQDYLLSDKADGLGLEDCPGQGSQALLQQGLQLRAGIRWEGDK